MGDQCASSWCQCSRKWRIQRERLDELWSEHKELFGHPSEPVFPLLIKILDAEDDLSVQVHPDDAYGMKHEGELGKLNAGISSMLNLVQKSSMVIMQRQEKN